VAQVRFTRRAGPLLLAIAILALAAPCVAQEPAAVGSPPPATGATTKPYTVQVGDVLEFAFFKNTELNQTRTVGPDGSVALQLIGGVKVADRTLAEITEEVTTRYARELTQPQVTVAVKDFGSLRVYVGGEVNQPGMQPYRGGLTTLQAVLAAGGFKNTASLKSVVVIRKGADGRPLGSRVDLGRVIKQAEFARDVALAPADIVFVPRSTIANVNLFVEQFFKNNTPIPVYLGFTPFTK
jgi:polysaccharide export outer membrane protein